MKFIALWLLLSFASVAQADEKPADRGDAPVYEIVATGDIEIGPDGAVYRYELDRGQPSSIEQALASSIEQWRFEPITVDGRPVIARTRMRMNIQAFPTASGNYRLRVDGVHFGEPERRNPHDMGPPRYPYSALRSDIGAQVVLVLKLDERGNVERVHTEQVNLDRRARNEHKAGEWREMFAEASVKAAQNWKFDIGETIDGEPVGGDVRVPVTFSIGKGRSGTNTWRSYLPGPRHPVPWVTDRALAAADATLLEDGEVQSLDSRFKLTTELVGSVL